jgi:hypothetical protein
MITPCGRAERDEIDLAAGGVETSELARALGGIPDDAVGADRHVVRAAPRRKRIRLHRDLRRDHRSPDGRGRCEQCRKERES